MAATTRKFSTLKRKADNLPPEERDALRRRSQEELDDQIEEHERRLADLRRARDLTQTQLARALDVSQAQVSRIENQTDLYVSTLLSYVSAMGGEVEIVARFDDAEDRAVRLPLQVGMWGKEIVDGALEKRVSRNGPSLKVLD